MVVRIVDFTATGLSNRLDITADRAIVAIHAVALSVIGGQERTIGDQLAQIPQDGSIRLEFTMIPLQPQAGGPGTRKEIPELHHSRLRSDDFADTVIRHRQINQRLEL